MNRRNIICFFLSLSIVFFSFGMAGTAGSLSPQPKNVILIVPDGCSSAVWGMIRAITVGAEGQLNIDKLPIQSICRTYSANSIITDSAAAGTAFASGVKTNNGVLGMDAATTRGDSLTGNPVETILEAAEKAGYSTGLVTTTMIQHATPAAFYAHRAERDWYPLISSDLLDSGIEVLFGGGREYMIPRGTTEESGSRSQRRDSRNIIEEMKAEGYTYVSDSAGFSAINPETTDRVLGLFTPHYLHYELVRQKEANPEPPLWDLAEKALEILSKNPMGFFLMIEAGQIDGAGHDNDTLNLIGDAIACDKTVGVASEFAEKHPNTLLIVVPDHGTGGPNLIGFYRTNDPESRTRSNEGVGLKPYELDANGFPVNFDEIPPAIGWASSQYYLHTRSVDGQHTGEDVSIHAMGPGSEKLIGLKNNTEINTIMRAHLGL
ncbi:alkaline phosphatase [Candidatus Latescibacterota bacterium]